MRSVFKSNACSAFTKNQNGTNHNRYEFARFKHVKSWEIEIGNRGIRQSHGRHGKECDQAIHFQAYS